MESEKKIAKDTAACTLHSCICEWMFGINLNQLILLLGASPVTGAAGRKR